MNALARFVNSQRTHRLLSISLSVVFLIVAVGVVVLVNRTMRHQALVEAEAKARILLDRNLATHTYFTHDLKPAVFELTDGYRPESYFEPSWMSSTYAVRHIDKYFKELNPNGYFFKDAAINARSPDNEADDFERSFLEALTADPNLAVSSGVRSIDNQPYFFSMRRGEILEESCLRCHSTPEAAPADMVAYYGPDRSFDRHEGDVISAVSIRIPLQEAYASADRFSLLLSGLLLLMLAGLFAAQWGFSHRLIFGPLTRLRDKAVEISTRSDHLGEEISVPLGGRDLQELTAAFNAMSVGLRRSVDQLEQRVAERTVELETVNQQLLQEMGVRAQAEETLCQEKDFAESLVDTMHAILLVLDTQGRIVRFNPYFQHLSGYKLEEVYAKDWFATFVSASERDRTRQLFQTSVANIHSRGNVTPIVTKAGQVRYVEWYDDTLKDAQGNVTGLLAVGQDITERRHMEEQLRQQERLAAVGQMAGGMAHDFNNLLTGVNGFAELMQLELSPDDHLYAMAGRILVSGQRLADEVKQLLAFSRKQMIDPQILHVDALLQRVVATARSELAERIRLQTVFPADLWPIKADANQIEQMLLNLMRQAQHWMPEGGTLTVEAANLCLLGEEHDEQGELLQGDYLALKLSDTGPSLSPHTGQRVFEPFFFKSDAVADGVGLRLAAAFGIVKQNGGHIWLESQPGQGNTFWVYLPRYTTA